MAKKLLEGRIRYDENYMGRGEHYVFELKWSDEEEWGLDTAYPLKNDMISYRALTKIREWQNLDIDFWFA